jgi:flagellar hook-basal body complex protein FliE
MTINTQPTVRLAEPGIRKDKTTPAEMTQSFGDYLKKAIDSVGSEEQNVQALTDKYMLGQVDVSEVMIASSQAELSLQLTSQIRNKVIEAYQDIMRTQI